MPDFKNKEEYEQWKAQRLKDVQEKKQAALNATAPGTKEAPGSK